MESIDDMIVNSVKNRIAKKRVHARKALENWPSRPQKALMVAKIREAFEAKLNETHNCPYRASMSTRVDCTWFKRPEKVIQEEMGKPVLFSFQLRFKTEVSKYNWNIFWQEFTTYINNNATNKAKLLDVVESTLYAHFEKEIAQQQLFVNNIIVDQKTCSIEVQMYKYKDEIDAIFERKGYSFSPGIGRNPPEKPPEPKKWLQNHKWHVGLTALCVLAVAGLAVF